MLHKNILRSFQVGFGILNALIFLSTFLTLASCSSKLKVNGNGSIAEKRETLAGDPLSTPNPAPTDEVATEKTSGNDEDPAKITASPSPSPVVANVGPTISVTAPVSTNGILSAMGFPIAFTATDPDDDAVIAIYYASSISNCDTTLTGWTPIASGLSENNATSHQWNTASVPNGTYYICGRISDGVNPDAFAVSPGSVTIVAPAAVTGLTTSHADGIFKAGEVMSLKITYDQPVIIAGGAPTLTLETGATDRAATYVSGSGTTDLNFTYTVQPGDHTLDLDVHGLGPQIGLNGASIKFSPFGLDANRNVPFGVQSGSLATTAAITIDTDAPTVSSPLLTSTIEDITTKTIRVHWPAASDNVTTAADLQYQLVYSVTDNITTAADAISNGTIVVPYTANVLVGTATSLTPNTVYYFNVLVKDAAGNTFVYTKNSFTSENFCGGAGTAGDPRQVCTLGDLHSMRDNLSEYYILNNDIDAAATSTWNGGAGWSPVGNQTSPFQGAFNGNSKVIRGLTSNRPTEDFIGLFGYVSSTKTFEKTGLQRANMIGKNAVGAFVGYFGGTAPIRYNYSTGSIQGAISAYPYGVGGLIGSMEYPTMTYCFSTANVTSASGNGYTGGLVGMNNYNSISYSYATGNISNTGMFTGGLVGQTRGAVSYSYATGDINSTSGHVGGLAGYTNVAAPASYSFATGNAYSSTTQTGGLVGVATNDVSYSAAHGHVFSTSDNGGVIGSASSVNLSYLFGSGKNTSTAGARGAMVGVATGGGGPTITKSYAFNWSDGKTCTSTSSDANCTLVTTGATKPFAFRFAPELEYVQIKHEETTPIPMRKIGSLDKSAYRIWGSCTVQGAQINISASDGTTTVNGTATCTAFSWTKELNLSSLLDAAVTITADQAGASTRTLNLVKESAFCDGSPTAGAFAGGAGTIGAPYLICTTAQFDQLRNFMGVSNYFRIMNSIDLSADYTGPIGADSSFDCSISFCGKIDGNGFVIKNAFVIRPGTDFVGVFGRFGNDVHSAGLSNLGFENIHTLGNNFVGSVAGMISRSPITNVYVQGSASSTGNYVGGFTGSITLNTGAEVSGVTSFAHALGYSNVASFAGYGYSFVGTAKYLKSSAHGHVIATNSYGGGFFGQNDNLIAQECYATGTVIVGNSGSYGGGFTGGNWPSQTNVEILKSYSGGSVIGAGSNLGGFIGTANIYHPENPVTVHQSAAYGHVIGPSTTNVGSFAGRLGAGTETAPQIIHDVIALGYVASSGNSAPLLGRNYGLSGSGSTLTNSFFWDKVDDGIGPACYTINDNTIDPITCNPGGIGDADFFEVFSNFTSATGIYTNWDFVNTWEFPSGGGAPILKWQYEP